MAANVKLLSLAASREVFMSSVQFVLGNWPAIRVSVEQCFGGQYSREKERWLQEVIYNVFMENGSLDPVDIEDYLAEILTNEFNVIIEDGSLAKVSEKLCHYYQLCKKGEHVKVAEEMNSIRLPKMNVKYEDGNNDDVEMQENGEVAEQLEELQLTDARSLHSAKKTTAVSEDNSSGLTRTNNASCDDAKRGEEDEGWVVVERGHSRKKRS
ncbi:pre-rRNA-processing protein TSR2 homolog [Dendronephthya gigantea]|uniref:pre-rRNA-processing protein TSR2 homolog n=1 Tax=Dendronephthya gigantea TaxID=151771 RepID=UPI00106A54E1|nr:pre-rRNA-processing protein TSR2 homolog [Dendronephthya gigantea]